MTLSWDTMIIESIGWLSTLAFLISIVVPNRMSLHKLGVFSSITTGAYAYYHGATAIWVKWLIALGFHIYMLWKLSSPPKVVSSDFEDGLEPTTAR